MGKTKGIKPEGALMARREAIMRSALELFIRKGYSAVSTDEIIRASGGSKATLYALFKNKEGLFREIVSSVADEVVSEVQIAVDPTISVREAIKRVGVRLCERILTKRGIGLYRLAVSASSSFPGISRLFYEAGPSFTLKAFAEFLRMETRAKRLKVDDPAMAADFYFGMLLVRHHIAMPLGCEEAPTRAEIEKIVDRATDVFLCAYGR